MKHNIKITFILLAMFFVTQLIGLAVISRYSPEIKQVTDVSGNVSNITSYNLPYGMDPPEGVTPQSTLISIIFAIAIAVFLMLMLMKYRAEIFLRVWFFVVVILALGITFNSFFIKYPNSSLIAIIIAVPIAIFKVFRRNIIIHNISELLIYPGIASIFVPLLNIWSIVLLLILISAYDIYAVWHAGFMQKMAQYQIEKLKVFTGFFIPYVGKKERAQIKNAKLSKSKDKKVKVSLAILGGGDVVFPLILAGVVFNAWGLLPSLIVTIFSTLALAYLFYTSEKGKFYPAMPFITTGSFVGLLIAYLIQL